MRQNGAVVVLFELKTEIWPGSFNAFPGRCFWIDPFDGVGYCCGFYSGFYESPL
jgi:hypothetical protein